MVSSGAERCFTAKTQLGCSKSAEAYEAVPAFVFGCACGHIYI